MEAKRLLMLTFVLSFILAININTASALPIWQFGLEDQSWAEFEAVAGGSFQPEYTVSFGNVTVDSPALNSGTGAPGYMYTQNPYPQYSHVDTAAVETLIFEFTLEDDYRQLDLSYGRFGSEIDYLYFPSYPLSYDVICFFLSYFIVYNENIYNPVIMHHYVKLFKTPCGKYYN